MQQGEEAADKEYDPDPVGYINETEDFGLLRDSAIDELEGSCTPIRSISAIGMAKNAVFEGHQRCIVFGYGPPESVPTPLGGNGENCSIDAAS